MYYLIVEGCAASRADVAADGVGRVVHDPLVDEQAAAQLEQFAARGADEAVVAMRRVQVRLVLLQGAARRELHGRTSDGSTLFFRRLALKLHFYHIPVTSQKFPTLEHSNIGTISCMGQIALEI